MSIKTSDDLRNSLAMFLRNRVNEWERNQFFVIDRVSFDMRELIKEGRRNYWGIFKKPKDPNTGRDKVFIPLTQSMVESVVKNIDLDTKDINLRSKKGESIHSVALARNAVKNELDEMSFGDLLDELERALSIDGSAVWKTWTDKNKITGKKQVRVELVDLLNLYIDPLAKDIQSTQIVIERALLPKEDIQAMKGWDNVEGVMEKESRHPSDRDLNATAETRKMVEIWEAWGVMPVGKNGEMKEAHVVVSNLMQDPVFHLIEENIKKIKPYEEVWYRRVQGRWKGVGLSEMLRMLQLWVNIIVNIRINRSYVSQLGIYTMKKSSGLTPQIFTRLLANGVLPVNSQDDIRQMPIQEASQASYNDEQVVQKWSERLTSAFEAATGEQLPASTPATNAAIAARNAQSAFVLIKEQIGLFLQRWMKRHFLPALGEVLTKEDIIRIQGDVKEIERVDENIANNILAREIRKMMKRGKFVDETQVQEEKNRIMEELKKQGENRFIKMLKNRDFSEYEAQVFVTNEEIDKGVLAQNLISVLQLAPQFQDQIIMNIFDIMGLDVNDLQKEKTGLNQLGMNAQQLQQQGLQAAAASVGKKVAPSQNPARLVQNANVAS